MKQTFEHEHKQHSQVRQVRRLGTRGRKVQFFLRGREEEGLPSSRCHQRAPPNTRRTNLTCWSQSTPLSVRSTTELEYLKLSRCTCFRQECELGQSCVSRLTCDHFNVRLRDISLRKFYRFQV